MTTKSDLALQINEKMKSEVDGRSTDKKIALSYEDGSIGEPVDFNWSIRIEGDHCLFDLNESADLSVDRGVATGLALLLGGEVFATISFDALWISPRVDAGLIVSIRRPLRASRKAPAIKDKSDE